jgi:recombination protein RecT
MCDSDANLENCEPGALMKCAMNATSLNLSLNKNLGYAYVIIYNGIPSFQIGYLGFIQLAIRTGSYETINAVEVREGEIERNKFTGEMKFLGEKPENKIIGYVAYLKLKSGFSASLYMSEALIEEHAIRFSKMYQYDKKNGKSSSKWSDPLARPKMALKTVLKGLLHTYGLMSTELIKAYESESEDETPSNSNRNTFTETEVIVQTEPEKKEVEKIQI